MATAVAFAGSAAGVSIGTMGGGGGGKKPYPTAGSTAEFTTRN
jgi:hypothetical protein